MKTLYDVLLNKKPYIKSLIDDDRRPFVNPVYRSKIKQIIEMSKSEQTPIKPHWVLMAEEKATGSPLRLIS